MDRDTRNTLAFTFAWLIALVLAWTWTVSVRGEELPAPAGPPQYVIAFTASWCGPCRDMRVIEDQVRAEGFDIRVVDIDQQQALKLGYRVQRVPTFVCVQEINGRGYELGRVVGPCRADELRALCQLQPVRPVRPLLPVRNCVRWLFGWPLIVP